MLSACGLVAAFLVSYLLKVALLGREQLDLWEPRYVRVLHVHESFVALMLLGGIAALVQVRRLGLPRGPQSPALEPRRLAGGLRLHRWSGRVAIVSALLGLLTAAYVLWGMYERAG